jgi:biotin synthase-like enzyme
MARPSKLKVITDNLEKIKEWKRNGATDEQICKALDITTSNWYKHLSENKELYEAIKNARQSLALDLRGELARQAMKHTLETKKQYIKHDLETGHKTQYTEITTKEVDGNVAAAHLLLKNIDGEHWKESWDTYEFKKQELELRRQQVENNSF